LCSSRRWGSASIASPPGARPFAQQEPSTHETAAFYTVEGGRITVPPTSPLRTRLGIAEVADKMSQRSLKLPAVVEADPARTAKVLPSAAGRVVDLKVQLGARVAAGDVLAVIESGDLAQAVSDLEKARSALTLTKQTLDRLLVLEKTRAIAVSREQAQSDYAHASRNSSGPKIGSRRSARPRIGKATTDICP
jgi:membrane fusion protein, heavy metal efflux system